MSFFTLLWSVLAMIASAINGVADTTHPSESRPALVEACLDTDTRMVWLEIAHYDDTVCDRSGLIVERYRAKGWRYWRVLPSLLRNGEDSVVNCYEDAPACTVEFRTYERESVGSALALAQSLIGASTSRVSALVAFPRAWIGDTYCGDEWSHNDYLAPTTAPTSTLALTDALEAGVYTVVFKRCHN